MKPLQRLLALGFLTPFLSVQAQTQAQNIAGGNAWHATNLLQAIGYMLLFALIGILTAIFGYRLFDKCTPGDLHGEIIEKKNVAAAIVGGAVILGVCIIVAAAMLG